MRPRTLFTLIVVSLLYVGLNLVSYFAPPPVGWGLLSAVRSSAQHQQ